MKQILLLMLAVITFFPTWAGEWQNFSNIYQVTDMEPVGMQTFVSGKGGLLIYNNLSRSKNFYTIINSSLPSNAVEQIARHPAGDIWIGTYDKGIARWNGVDFEVYPFPAGFDLLLQMKFGLDGKLLIQAVNGAYTFDVNTHQYTKFNESSSSSWFYNAWSFDQVNSLFLQVFTGSTIYNVNTLTYSVIDSFTTIDPSLTTGCSPVNTSIFSINNDIVLMQLGNRLAFIHKDGSSTTDMNNLPIASDYKIVRATNGKLHCMVDGFSIYELNDTLWSLKYDLGGSTVADNYFYENGDVGCFQYNTTCDLYTHTSTTMHIRFDIKKYIFNQNTFNSICSDAYGNLFGLTNRDIYKYSVFTNTWTYQTTAPGIFGVAKDIRMVNGRMFTIDYGNLLSYYDGISWTSIPYAPGATSPYVYSYDVKEDYTIFFTNSDGLHRYKSGITLTLFGGTGYSEVKVDKHRNVLWYIYNNIIYSYNLSTAAIQSYSNANFPSIPAGFDIYTIQVDETDHSVWFGGRNNDVLVYDGDFSVLHVPFTNPANIVQIENGSGNIKYFLNEYYDGFYMYDGSNWRFIHPTTMPDMADRSVHDIETNILGHVYVNHQNQSGVSYYNAIINTVESIQTNFKIDMYPNPCSDKFVVTTKNIDDPYISLYAMDGRFIAQYPVNASGETPIDVGSLQNAIYIVKVGNYTSKIVVYHN